MSMLQPESQPAKAKRNSTPSTQSSMRLARDVTAETYAVKAKAFILANDNVGFVIAIQDTAKADAITARQWGAWLSYFKRLGIKGYPALMERLGYFTVPAEWPHLFDADATVQSDNAAADGFERIEGDRKRKFNLSQAAGSAAKKTNIWNQIRREKFQQAPVEPEKPQWWNAE